MKFTLFALALAASPLLAAEEGFVTLFDGKTFDGWKVSENPDSFVIEDGMLVAKGPRAHAFYVGEDGKATFEDFELRLDVMTKENSNGGVFFHVAYQEKGWPIKQGYEVQVNNTHKDWRKTGGLYAIVDNKEPFKDDEWMKYVIRVEDGVVNVTVNGKEVVKDFKPEGEQDKLVEGGGMIALQAHDPGSTVYYKNIRIKALD
ncbi:DUF1080 domain-containing protein [Haloferula sp. A504]|uniref:DUF1080 domain-containing protein n=1 Tax=Haloferula sp. A504 TaxID=3373601 RepID=UPI0031C401A0|nr:DUF1080 domain-containing protein [Verrucomicrobiaceae bacterium E54]